MRIAAGVMPIAWRVWTKRCGYESGLSWWRSFYRSISATANPFRRTNRCCRRLLPYRNVSVFYRNQDSSPTMKMTRPATNSTPPAAMAMILFLLSAAVSSDQGFCFLPMAMPITMPAPIPTAKPIGYPSIRTIPLSFCRHYTPGM